MYRRALWLRPCAAALNPAAAAAPGRLASQALTGRPGVLAAGSRHGRHVGAADRGWLSRGVLRLCLRSRCRRARPEAGAGLEPGSRRLGRDGGVSRTSPSSASASLSCPKGSWPAPARHGVRRRLHFRWRHGPDQPGAEAASPRHQHGRPIPLRPGEPQARPPRSARLSAGDESAPLLRGVGRQLVQHHDIGCTASAVQCIGGPSIRSRDRPPAAEPA
jgi:hypothetical protein